MATFLSVVFFSRLCEPFMESGAVNYKLLLTSLGMSMWNGKTTSVNKGLGLIERLVQDVFRKRKTHPAGTYLFSLSKSTP